MMLPRAASRVFNGKHPSNVIRTLGSLTSPRNYSQDGRQPPNRPVPDPSSQSKGPARNRTWPSDRSKKPAAPQHNTPPVDDPLLQDAAAKTADFTDLPETQPKTPAQAQVQDAKQTPVAESRKVFSADELARSGTARAMLGHQNQSSGQAREDAIRSTGLDPNSTESSSLPNGRSQHLAELDAEIESLVQANYITTKTHKELHELLAKKEALRHSGSQDSVSGSPPIPDIRFGIPSEAPEPFYQDKSQPSASSPPLPDLRQGIPSSFNMDTSATAQSFNPRGSESSSLEITEDPTRGGGSKRSEGLPRDAYTTSIERRRLRLARYMYIFLFGSIAGAVIYSGRNWDNEQEEAEHPDAPSGWSPTAFYNRVSARISSQMGFYTEPAFPKLLPTLDPSISRPYTLVLSLEDLLIHSEWSREHGWRLAKRPGVDYFLRYLSQYYELVIFTSVQMMNADPIIRKLDPYQIVMWPLFREATRYVNGEHVKDLSYLNRDLSKTIIIDTVPAHVQLQPENSVILPKWLGDPKAKNKNDLVALIPFLEYIAAMSIDDVRKVIKSFEGQDIPTEFAAREAKAREAFNKQLAEEKGRRKFGGGLSSALGMKPGAHGMMVPGEPSFQEGLAQGKMLSDQARERGIRNYQLLEKEIQENGQKWLDEMAAEQKKAQEESMKAVQSGVSGFMGNFGSVFGASPPSGTGDGGSQERPKK